MNNQDLINLLSVLVPVVTTAVSIIGVAWRDRRSRRSAVGRRKLALDDARAQVEFVAAWCAAKQALDEAGVSGAGASPAEQAETSRLTSASELVEQTALVLPSHQTKLTFSRLVLLYPFKTSAGKVVRTLFFVCCGLTVTSVGATITQAISPEDARQSWVSYYLVLGTVIAPLAVAVRFLAVAVDNYAAEAPGASGSPARGVLSWVLLAYPMLSGGAKAVRLLFYLSILGVLAYVGIYATATVLRPDNSWLLPLNLAGTLVYGAAVLGVRAWAVSIDQTHREAEVHREAQVHRTVEVTS